MMNTGFSTGALRLATGTYEAWGFSRYESTETIETPLDENCWNRKKPGYQETSTYHKKTYDYINPNSITAITEVKYNPNTGRTVKAGTTIRTADGESYTTSLSREKVINCAQQALETGKVIDLIA